MESQNLVLSPFKEVNIEYLKYNATPPMFKVVTLRRLQQPPISGRIKTIS